MAFIFLKLHLDGWIYQLYKTRLSFMLCLESYGIHTPFHKQKPYPDTDLKLTLGVKAGKSKSFPLQSQIVLFDLSGIMGVKENKQALCD